MSWTITGKEAGSLGLLDQYGGAAAAYSLRSLTLYYTGPVVRVRRDNDNAEQDFTATEVSDGTLSAWVGAGNDGFVRTWYDQSGNGHDIQQTTPGNQPKIVDSSIGLITQNGKAALDFDGVDDNLSLSAPIPASEYLLSLFLASKSDVLTYSNTGAANLGNFSFSATDNRFYGGSSTSYNPGKIGWQFGTFDINSNNTSSNTSHGTATFLISVFTNGTVFINSILENTQIPVTAGGITFLNISIGGSGNNFWNGKYHEIIMYRSDQSANRAPIEANINAHYSIY